MYIDFNGMIVHNVIEACSEYGKSRGLFFELGFSLSDSTVRFGWSVDGATPPSDWGAGVISCGSIPAGLSFSEQDLRQLLVDRVYFACHSAGALAK